MLTNNLDLNWFALHVRPRYEKQVATILGYKGLDAFLPTYRSRRRWADRYKTVELPLFPGYVFSRFRSAAFVPVMTTPGVIDILRTGNLISPVDEHEIHSLQTLMTTTLSFEPWEYLAVGQRVRIDNGPLKNVTGILVNVKKTARVLLSVTLLKRSVLVEIDRDWIKPCENFAFIASLRQDVSVGQPSR